MAKDSADFADAPIKSGASCKSFVTLWNDDSGTFASGGDAGWLRPADIPEPALASAVQSLAPGGVTGIVRTNRGYSIATVLERRGDQVHLGAILVLAPAVDLYSPQGTPAWFTTFIDDRDAALRRAGRIELKVGSSASG